MQIIPGWHPLLVHFAVALSITGCTALLISRLLRGRGAQRCAVLGTLSLSLGAVFCLLALASGIAAVWDASFDVPTRAAVSRHVLWAFFTSLGVLLLAVWRTAGHVPEEPPSDFMLMVAAAVALAVAVTGWLGGENVFRFGIGVLRASGA